MEQKYQSLGLVAGANLKRLIKQSSYKTQEEFAYVFGTDVRTVGRWINHGIDRLSTIEQIADFFGMFYPPIHFPFSSFCSVVVSRQVLGKGLPGLRLGNITPLYWHSLKTPARDRVRWRETFPWQSII